MRRLNLALALVCGVICSADAVGDQPAAVVVVRADVIVAGGSTAALAAAFAAAEEGATTVLLEPTDWIGGQLTASGVPAVDEAWHKIRDERGEVVLDVSRIARDPRNMNPALLRMLNSIGNPGRGWVSRFCFEPRTLLEEHLLPWEQRLADKLTVYRETVVKRVEVDHGRPMVLAIEAIQRQPRAGVASRGYDRLPSVDIPDWYHRQPSARFEKSVLRFEGKPRAVFIDATEWGEVLALSGGEYLQGVDRGGHMVPGCDRYGQATVFGFVQQLHESPAKDLARKVEGVTHLGLGKYETRDDAWEKIWTYRRLRGSAAEPRPGDLSLQNWGYSLQRENGGNDYPFGYLFLDCESTAATRDDWRGGVNLAVMAAAERRALAWHHWFKNQAPGEVDSSRITLALDVLGTGHGLSKLPYIRDTRRSIGLDGFVLQLADLVGNEGDATARQFQDTIAIGAYPSDVHHIADRDYPPQVAEHLDTRPFCIPFRALTHRKYENLLVAGKTMAQSFMANSATRLHPIEWSTGTAAGVSAALMCQNSWSADEALRNFRQLQEKVARRTPVQWQIGTAD